MSTIMECPNRPEYAKNVVLAAERFKDTDVLRGACVLISGASGMVGGAIARTLLYLNRTQNLGMRVVLPIRETTSLTSLSGVCDRDEVKLITWDMTREIELEDKIDYIIHAASPTDSKYLRHNSADTARFMALSAVNMLELARKNQVRGMVYLSSMEAYGQMDGEASEDMLGHIDLTSPRSCYPEGKRFCENLVACYANQYNLNACSVRLAQVVGAGIKDNENRAYASFAVSALKGRDIILKTDGTSQGNYVHTIDAVSGILYLMCRAEKGEIYNLAGDSADINTLARTISRILSGGKSHIVHDIDNTSPLPYAPKTGIKLSSRKLESRGFKCLYTLDDMIVSLGRDLTDLQKA